MKHGRYSTLHNLANIVKYRAVLRDATWALSIPCMSVYIIWKSYGRHLSRCRFVRLTLKFDWFIHLKSKYVIFDSNLTLTLRTIGNLVYLWKIVKMTVLELDMKWAHSINIIMCPMVIFICAYLHWTTVSNPSWNCLYISRCDTGSSIILA